MKDQVPEMNTRTPHPQAGRSPRGRPRDPTTDSRILAATTRLLIEVGYARMSLDAVAELARVGKPAIYRRYHSKVELAAAALSQLPQLAESPPPGNARSQILWLLRLFLRLQKELAPWALLGTVLAEEHRHPELLALLRERVILPRRAEIRAALDRGVERGEVTPTVDFDLAVDVLTGPIFTRRIAVGEFSADWVDKLLDHVWPTLAAASDES